MTIEGEKKTPSSDASIGDSGVIEGGFVSELGDLGWNETQHRSETARTLSVTLVAFLGLTILLHYGCVIGMVVAENDKGVEALSKIFNVWLPVISGLVGSSVTYYFTRDK